MTRRSRALASVLSVALLLFAPSACSPPEDPPWEVTEATIADVHRAILADGVSCRTVVEAHLERILAYDQPLGLNAVSMVHPQALERADELDRRLASGEEPGPLFCIPVLVKDNFDTFDLPTTAGSVALAENVPPEDATMVRRLREAGAVILAKTNMAEWAFSPRQTISSTRGTTANAYDPGRVPAGSSGGTASGVAASFGVVGLGSDTGNSIRGPSSHLALVGIRSTLGLTSRAGVIPLAFDRDVAGPMARTVEDAARVLTVVAGFDPRDPYTEVVRGREAEDYTRALVGGGLEGVRLGVLRALVDVEDADPEILELFEAAVDHLRRLGAEIVDPFEVERLEAHRQARGNFCQRFRHDMWVYLRTLGEGAPIRDVMEVLESGDHSPDVEGRLQALAGSPLEIHPSAWDPPCPDYLQHPGRQAFLGDLVDSMDRAAVDAFLHPTWTAPPAPLHRGNEDYAGDNSQVIAPATGIPAITVPMGFTGGSLPAGLQILGRPYSEGLLFRIAHAYEQATAHRRPPPGFPPLSRGGEGG